MFVSYCKKRVDIRYLGIRQWPINKCTSPMMIHNITLLWLKSKNIQHNEPTNRNSIKDPKVDKPNE